MQYADHLTTRTAITTPGTVANLIERYIAEMNGSASERAIRTLGVTHAYALRMLQRLPIGAKRAADLTKHEIIDHCKARRATASPATVNLDVAYLAGVLKYAAAAWQDCADVSDAPIAAAKTFLVRHALIGKGAPRTRVPTNDEIDKLLGYFAATASRTTIPMADIVAFALVSARRIGEICRMRHSDIDWERRDADGNETPMYMVRDMKHPRKKQGNNKWFALLPEMAEIVRRQPVLPGDDRVFPFAAKSVGAAYTRAKRALGIHGLRFHDNRREAITRWLAKLNNPHKVRLISGHETTLVLERVYDATDPATLHAEIARARAAA